MAADCPKLRPLEAIPVQMQGRQMIALRDPQGLAPQTISLSRDLFFIVSLFDGEHSVVDIQTEYARRFGELIFSEKIQEIVEQLDANYFLDSERFSEFVSGLEREFASQEARPPFHAGRAYPGDATELRARLKSFFDDAEGTPPEEAPGPAPLKGIVAPHIDFDRGGPCFAQAYGQIAGTCEADLFVILGTIHVGTKRRFVLTRKDFATPLGRARTDGEVVDAVASGLAEDFLADELTHRTEHSLEFQVVFLQYVLGADREFCILPVLCSSLAEQTGQGQTPDDVPEVAAFLEALKAALTSSGRPFCVIAGADLAHVGPRFGDQQPITPGVAQVVEQEDRQMLEFVRASDRTAFFGSIQEEGDKRKICGVPPIYAMLHLIEPCQGRLLKYDQAIDENGHSLVSFASMTFH